MNAYAHPITFDPAAPTVLIVATDWFSEYGGLSTFNRRLGAGLAAAGARVLCLVPRQSEAESAHAARRGVRLISAPPMIGGSLRHALVRRPVLPSGVTPDIVIGHGRITGSEAGVLVEDHYPHAARLHLVHMAADELEWWRSDQSAAGPDPGEQAEQRTTTEWELSRTATRVLAVGPVLHRTMCRDLSVFAGTPQPLRLDPGFDDPDLTTALTAPRLPPPGCPAQILLLGRLQDYLIKGVDLAARAAAAALRLRGPDGPDVELLVRGAPAGASAALRQRILDWSGTSSLRVTVRPFTTDAERLRQDFQRATLVLMPSRAEGFGLAGAEAVAAGTPVLVSARSGLGELVREVLPGAQADRIVVPVSGNDEHDEVRWAHHIASVLADPSSAFTAAEHLRRIVTSQFTWRRAAEEILSAGRVEERAAR
ncbi:glycosyltransferase family 4 protein [Catellatospora methionotrophica]|uniref:glycosyltransferase family 4 protein n=1 Tax=Catellatospora methionotrophica TaxID=121620 RepID=UPI0033F576BC